MRIEVVKKIDYKGCPIYIRKIGNLFEYLIVYQGKLYSEYFDIKPDKLRGDYTRKQFDNIIKLVYFSAYKTIDKLKK